ncbi:MAG: L,D-transpeptidase family protein [Pseudomonadota bacterium]
MNILIDGSGETYFMGQKISYKIGKNGLTSTKVEGDRKTPIGFLQPLAVYYRAGRMIRPKTRLPVYPIFPNDGWCDHPHDFYYNQHVRLPFRSSAEALWRQDRLYDLFLVTNYNYPIATPGRGSAIFIHIMHPDQTPTQGCIAFEPTILRRIIQNMRVGEGFLVLI